MTSISKTSATTFSSQLLGFVFGICTSIVLARVLGPTARGIYALIILIPAVMLQLGSLGMEAANIYFTGSRRYEIKDIVSNSLFSSVLLGLVLILLFLGVFGLGIFRSFIYSKQINSFYLWLVVLTVPFSLLSSFLRSILLGKQKIITVNKIDVLTTILGAVAILFFLLILRQGLFGAILSHVLTIIVITSLLILLVGRMTKIRFSFNQRLFKDSAKYGLKAYFGNLAQFLNYRLDTFIVAAFLAPAEVGYYSLAVGLVERLWMFPQAIATVLFPKVSSMEDIEANNLTPRVSRHTFFVVFVLSFVLAVLAKWMIKILYTRAFLPSVVPLLILLPGIIALSGAKILTADLAGRGKPQFGTYGSFVSLAFTIPLDLYLIPKWGIAGAAFASSVSYIVAALLVTIAFVKISGKSWLDVLLIKKQDFGDYRNLLLKLRTKLFAGSR